MRGERSRLAFERACRSIPGGVNSPVRAFRAVGGSPVVIARGEGSRLFDLDGRAFVDACLSWGPLILGHAPPAVVVAVQRAAARGLSFGACHEPEAELAEAILRGYPAFARVRLVSSGTEAVMTAVRLARAATGRELVVKFAGGYHGHSDGLLVEAGSGLATFGTASSAGVPAAVAGTTLVAPFDDEAAFARLMDEHGPRVAAVLLELLPANDGLLIQRRDFLRAVREETTRAGALLILDEVITGFRLRYGGAGPVVGIEPDLVTLGKVIGGGMPVGATCGPKHLLDRLAPQGPVYQAGTLSGNPLSVAAGLATLAALADGSAHARLEALGARLEARLAAAPAGAVRCVRAGSMLWPWLGEGEPPRSPDRITPRHVERFRGLHGEALRRGAYLPPSAREVLFLSTAHSEEDVDLVAEALSSGLAS